VGTFHNRAIIIITFAFTACIRLPLSRQSL